MSQYTQNQENRIIETFTGFLLFLGISEPNMEKVQDAKILFKFSDGEIQKHWTAFYASYAFGHHQGRVYQANHDAILMTQQIHDLEQGK